MPSNKKTRTPGPRFKLTAVERMLLQFYRTVPVETRARVGQILFDSWTHPADDAEAAEMEARYEPATRAFKTGPLYISVIDDMRAGGIFRAEDLEGGAR